VPCLSCSNLHACRARGDATARTIASMGRDPQSPNGLTRMSRRVTRKARRHAAPRASAKISKGC